MAALFVIGGLCGSVLTYGLIGPGRHLGRRADQAWEARLLARMQAEVSLTPAQLSAFRPEIEDAIQRTKDARRQALIDGDLNIDAALARIAGQLGPEQRLRMEQFRAKRRAHFLSWVSKHLQ
ncbi:MAG: hypothetical protein JOY92_01545 [Verrucomicrobia bacterium]|nr:hypothetical protein [Verrucomicrobiota bacterium]